MKQMRTISILWGSLLVIALGVLTFIGFQIKERDLDYKELEETLTDGAEKYVEAYSTYPKGEDKLKISFEDLIKYDIIDKSKLDKKKCSDAYVLVYQKALVYHFDSYLKCQNYTTKNYK